jgi:2-polyprenyl-3-methyl-5-hydroxy-6-metoxy-1,4-benzoquinol methylase
MSDIERPRDESAMSVDDYGWESTAVPESCNYIAPRVLSLLKALRVRRVADLGCGNGALCASLRREGFEVVGIENDGRGCQLARHNHPEIAFYKYGVQDDPAELLARELGFDLVVSTEVIEHLFSPHLLPRYARSILNDGGLLVISTPYHGYLKNLVLSLFNHWDAHHTPLWHGGHIKFWSKKTLTALLEANGFRVISFDGVGRCPLLWKSMILTARKA